MFEFRVLGPLEVGNDGQSLRLRGNRERVLLTLLLLNANRTISAERLAEDLWDGAPPDGAIRLLRVYVSRLRHALGPAGQAVVTRPSGYALEVDPEAVDTLRFEALVARGRVQARGGDHEQAAETLHEALTLWRGPALADVADAPFARAEATRLEEARLAAVEDRIEADLACGRHGEVTAELEALTGEHPFRERLWSQRIIALYRSGRQADALRAYQQLRSTLGEQLGIEPSSALQQLEGAVLRHDPVLDWHPPGERVAAAPGRLPQPLVRKERLPLVGREVELSRLDQLWQATRSGQRQLVLVAGEPGIGKSRLAAEFARTGHGGGAPVVFGRCDEGMGVPYQPFVEALSRYLRQTSRPILGRLAGELVRLDPEVGERVHGLSPPLRSDPETERYRLFDAVAAWLGAMSETAPVLFVIEDLHWATKPTLLLLSHLLRSDEDLRLLLLVTFRDTPLDMSPDLADLVAELLRQPGVERVRLAGLDEAGVAALMEAQAGHDLDDEGWALARIVHGETAGNPFYVREMLSLLAEKGDIVRRDGRWVPGLPLAHLDVPDSVRDVVERRLTRLPDQTSEMLAVAAVLGERFDLALLAAARGESETSVIETLRPAVSARLVAETDAGRYQFIHALVRSALEDALGPTRRLQLHRAAGSAIEAVHAGHLDDHLPALAHHWARASAPAADPTRAVEYATRAGDRALAQLAHDEAARYYASALDLLDAGGADPTDSRRVELLIGRGEAQRRAGDADYRQTLLDAAHLAEQLGDSAALARAALANTLGYLWTAFSVDTDRIEVLESAIAAVGGEDQALRARLLATLALELTWQPDPTRRVALSEEALQIARTANDPATLAHVLLARDYTITDPENVAERFNATSEVLAIADQLGDPVMASRALSLRFKAAMQLPDVAEAERSLVRNEALIAELGQPDLTYFVLHHRATLAFLRGDPGAEQKHCAAEELGRTIAGPEIIAAPRIFSFARAFWPRTQQGRAGELEGTARLLAERVPGSFFKSLYAVLLAEAGQIEAAARLFDGFAAQEFAYPRHNAAWILFEAECARLCAILGRADRVPLLRPMLENYANQLVVSGFAGWIGGSVSLYLGLLATTVGDWSDAEARFAAAAATHERIGAPTLLAYTRLEWARMLLARAEPKDGDRADEFLHQALATARELGLAKIEREAVGLLA